MWHIAWVAMVLVTVLWGCDGNVSWQEDTEPYNWHTEGRDAGETYFSPLTQINDKTVKELGFAWSYDTYTNRGLEATPLVIDGILYTSGNWGVVYALDAKTGAEIWTFDPKVDGQVARKACCDIINRGLVISHGLIYVAALDGRLFALDAESGAVVWETDTIDDKSREYTITGAPQIAGDVVVIGNSGADFNARGYVTAYDRTTGEFRWRFYTVPGDPSKPFEHPELAMAAKTWDPNSLWEVGGGGTVWDAMAYDKDLNLLYVGTGNAAPYSWKDRSPAGGDNLFLASILALNPDNGRLVWYYQTVPGENWDYTATQKMILTDLEIQGKRRKVLMQAPKNGFFYVLDRATGELLSAKNYTTVTWASHVDLKTGRPVMTAQGDYHEQPKLVFPSMAGGHNWHPMAYNPMVGLVYIPTIEAPMVFIRSIDPQAVRAEDRVRVAGIFPGSEGTGHYGHVKNGVPSMVELNKGQPTPRVGGVLKAWDPIRQKVAWETQVSTIWDGGVMTTAGNLVFQGRATGELVVYAADSGRVLHKIDTGSSIMAAPMTYMVDGVQYVAVMAGFGGALWSSYPPQSAAYKYGNDGRILAFKLGGGAVPMPPPLVDEPMPKPPLRRVPQDVSERGRQIFLSTCARCHANSGRGGSPDLRRMGEAAHENFEGIVLHGLRSPGGMPGFSDVLGAEDAAAIHGYLIDAAWKAYDAEQEASEIR